MKVKFVPQSLASVFAENALKCQTTSFNPTGNETPVIDMSDVEDPSDTEQDGTGDEKGDKKVGGKYMSLCDSAAALSWESQVMRGERSHPMRWEFCSNSLVQVLIIFIHQSQSLAPTRGIHQLQNSCQTTGMLLRVASKWGYLLISESSIYIIPVLPINIDSASSTYAASGIPGSHQVRVNTWHDAQTLYNKLYVQNWIVCVHT